MRKMNQRGMNIKRLSLLLCLFFLFPGCTPALLQDRDSGNSDSQITLYLNGPERSVLDISFELASVSIIAEDGTARQIMDAPVSLNSRSLERGQILLGDLRLPEGRYRKLQLGVSRAFMQKGERTALLALPDDDITVDVDVLVKTGQNTTLFLIWDGDASLREGYLFDPVLDLRRQKPELTSLLIYVSNEESNNVSVINRDSGEIVATIMVGKRPRGIASSSGGERPRVYVANSGSNSISVIDPTTNTVENEIPIRFGQQPEAIAVARLSSERALIFTANYISNTVSVFDASTHQELEKIPVGRGPAALAADPPAEHFGDRQLLSVEEAAALRNYRNTFLNVYVVNENSNNISLIKMNRKTGRSAEVLHFNAEWRPVALDVDAERGRAYIANYDSDNLTVLNLVEIAVDNDAGALSTISNAGSYIIGVAADPLMDRIYLLRDMPAEIRIIRPFTEGAEILEGMMPPVVGTVPVGRSPRALAFGPEGRKVYVVNRGSDTVSVVDRTTRRVEQSIAVGKGPYSIAVFEK